MTRDEVLHAVQQAQPVRQCKLTGMDFSRCDLSATLFERCDFTQARLQGADLTDAQFIGCTFAHADLSGCIARRTSAFEGPLTAQSASVGSGQGVPHADCPDS